MRNTSRKRVAMGMAWRSMRMIFAALTATLCIPSAVYAQNNLATNAGFEQAWFAPELANGWSPFWSGYQRVTATSRTDANSIRLSNVSTSQLSGAYQRIDLYQTEVKPVFLGTWVRGENIVNSPFGYFGASLYAEIHLNDGSIVYWNSVPNFGSFDWRWIGFNTSTPMAVSDFDSVVVDKPINFIYIVPILAYASGTAWFDDVQIEEFDATPLDGMHSAVTFMFDDAQSNVYSVAKPVLDRYGFKGSVAVISSTVYDTNEPNRFHLTLAQLLALQDAGWEIVSHGVTHADLKSLPREDAIAELRDSLRDLEAFGFSVKNFAFPFGAYNADLLAWGADYYRSIRAYEIGDNPRGVFPYDVKVRNVAPTTTVDDVAQWVSEASLNHRWMVLVFHSAATNNFARIIQAVAASGVPVVTYDQGVDEFAVTP